MLAGTLSFRRLRLLSVGTFTLWLFLMEATAQQQPATGSAPNPAPAPAADANETVRPVPPPPTSQPSPEQGAKGQQTKRILGIIPNFRSVSVNTYLPPERAKEKFVGFTQDSFDYSSFIFVGMLAGVSQLQNSTPEFKQGVAGYGRYYWHTFVDQTNENLWVGFLLPTALHHDPRYYTLGSGTPTQHNGFMKRTGYALSRVVVTRTDAGGRAFNFSEVVGSGTAAGIANLYYPSSTRGWTKTGQRWVLNVGLDGATFIFKEFWPDINHAIFHTK
jgi:hypothetical protein